MEQVLITGASGFIGTRLCEVMMLTGCWKPRALVHSTASAARIAKFPIDFVLGDLCDPESVDRAVNGCSAIVHLARGENKVMTTGLENVLRAALKYRCSRVILLSSVAVYGDNPPPDSVSEDAPVRSPVNTYGQIKLWQEKSLIRFGKRHGLPYVILRPPNVYGAFSHYTQTLISRAQAGTLAIVNPGDNPCNLVYIDNLMEAILLSLWKAEALGATFFVTDRDVVSWSKCLTDHAEWVGVKLPRVSIQELVAPVRQRLVLDSAKLLPQILLSGEMRNLLRKIPIIDLLEGGLYRCFRSLSSETQQKLRVALNGPVCFSKNGCVAPIFYKDDPNISSQSRSVAHSSEKARSVLGYSAPVSYEEGMALTKAWATSVGMLMS